MATREPGDLPSAVVTRASIGQGVPMGSLNRQIGRQAPLRGDVPHVAKGPCPCFSLSLFCRRCIRSPGFPPNGFRFIGSYPSKEPDSTIANM